MIILEYHQKKKEMRRAEVTEINGINHYGKNIPYLGLERKFQVSAMKHFRLFDRLAFHVPNGSKRDVKYGKMLKDQGLLKGYPDVCSDLPCKGFNGARLELKNKKGKLQKEQLEILLELKQRGFYVGVAWGLDGVFRFCQDYYK